MVHLGSTPETIRLDLTATRDNPTLTAVIRITGTAEKPVITLTSTPVLPQDEVLSQVLFGSSVSSLNGFQAAQLASALSGLASGGGFDVIGGIRALAHLDRLAINSSATGGNSIAGGKYLTDKRLSRAVRRREGGPGRPGRVAGHQTSRPRLPRHQPGRPGDLRALAEGLRNGGAGRAEAKGIGFLAGAWAFERHPRVGPPGNSRSPC